ncbi:hypothetical protein NFI96_011691 [Prochilodus magdalenae]|nr:hypothetical protein NFI96_011691 [Prochilodus magdalenae]
MCNTAPLHVQLAQAASGQQLDSPHSQRKSPAWSAQLTPNSKLARPARTGHVTVNDKWRFSVDVQEYPLPSPPQPFSWAQEEMRQLSTEETCSNSDMVDTCAFMILQETGVGDTQQKAMEMTISNAENYMGQFCTLLAAYTRKTAKLRDKADMLARQLYDFAGTEDPELSICLKNLSEDLAMVQDYRQAEVERLDVRVVTPLKAYGDIVKTKRADLKKFSADRDRELKELHRLEKIRLKNPADRQSIIVFEISVLSNPAQAEVNVQKASSNANRSTRQMEDTIIEFQKQKLEDVKRIFTEFIMVEMLFHAKALEVYTHTFKNMETMDIHKDLELFKNRIQVTGSLLETTASTADMARSPSPPVSTLRLPQYASPPISTSRLHQYPSPPSTIPRMNFEQPKQALSSVLRRQREMEEDEQEDEDEEEDRKGLDFTDEYLSDILAYELVSAVNSHTNIITRQVRNSG